FLDPKYQFHLTVTVSVAIVLWLESMLPVPVKVKWPNDIYVGDQKIGGMLIENMLKGKTWKSAIVGIGVNVNQTAFPAEIHGHATSIKQLLQEDRDIMELLVSLRRHIEQSYNMLKNGAFDTLLLNYKHHLYRLGELHTFLVD